MYLQEQMQVLRPILRLVRVQVQVMRALATCARHGVARRVVGEESAKVKKRRQEREEEREAWEAEKERMQREADEAEFGASAAQEDKFHLRQTRVRSQIRIREGRAKATDRLTRNLSSVGTDEFDIEVPQPYTIFDGLSLYETEEVRDDIKTNLEFDTDNAEFWTCMMVVCDDARSARQRPGEAGRACKFNRGIFSAAIAQIQTC